MISFSKRKQKVKLNCLSLTGLACFLYKNTNMFTFSDLRSVFYFSLKTKSSVALHLRRTPLRSCWRGEWKHNGRVLLPLCIRAASALLTRAGWNGCKPGSTEALALKAPVFTWSVKSDSCYIVLRLCSARCMKQRLWSSADMHSHKCDHVKSLFAHSQKMVANAACGFFMYRERSLERLSSSGTWTIISSYLLLFIAWNKHDFLC